MSFKAALLPIVEEAGGGLAALLMGRDGIPVEQVSAGGVGEETAEEVHNAAVELARIVDEICKASSAFGGGELGETVIVLERFQVVMRPVDEDLVLVVALEPTGNLGKARFLVRRYLPSIQSQL